MSLQIFVAWELQWNTNKAVIIPIKVSIIEIKALAEVERVPSKKRQKFNMRVVLGRLWEKFGDKLKNNRDTGTKLAGNTLFGDIQFQIKKYRRRLA